MNVKKHKPTIQLFSDIGLIALGCGLLIAGFVLPPSGEILTFAGALFGIDYHYKYKDHDNNQ